MKINSGPGASASAVSAIQTDVDDLQVREISVVRKTITFTGGAGLGAVGAVPLFTTTGQVLIERLVPFCTTLLTEGGATATLALGVTGSTSLFIAATNAVEIDANEFWVDTTPDSFGVAIPGALLQIAITANIIGTVAAQAVDSGVLAFTAYWRPLSSGATLVAA